MPRTCRNRADLPHVRPPRAGCILGELTIRSTRFLRLRQPRCIDALIMMRLSMPCVTPSRQLAPKAWLEPARLLFRMALVSKRLPPAHPPLLPRASQSPLMTIGLMPTYLGTGTAPVKARALKAVFPFSSPRGHANCCALLIFKEIPLPASILTRFSFLTSHTPTPRTPGSESARAVSALVLSEHCDWPAARGGCGAWWGLGSADAVGLSRVGVCALRSESAAPAAAAQADGAAATAAAQCAHRPHSFPSGARPAFWLLADRLRYNICCKLVLQHISVFTLLSSVSLPRRCLSIRLRTGRLTSLRLFLGPTLAHSPGPRRASVSSSSSSSSRKRSSWRDRWRRRRSSSNSSSTAWCRRRRPWPVTQSPPTPARLMLRLKQRRRRGRSRLTQRPPGRRRELFACSLRAAWVGRAPRGTDSRSRGSRFVHTFQLGIFFFHFWVGSNQHRAPHGAGEPGLGRGTGAVSN